jgi:chromosome segregation ATPase
MTKAALQTALDESLSFCAEYRKIIEKQALRIRELETALQERTSQLERFSEAYRKLKAGLEFYIPQIEEMKRQKYSLRKQYETALEEEKQKLGKEFAQLSSSYKEFARAEIAKAVEKVRAEQESAEEICASFALGLLKDFEKALPAVASKPSAGPSGSSKKG